MDEKKFYSLLGLCMRARRLFSGEFAVEKGVKRGEVYLVILAEDASDNTRKRFRDMCSYHKVPYAEYTDKESLGHAIGKEFRASLCVVDANLAQQIRSKIDECELAQNGGSDKWQK